jgi:coproporphyrinogen III oxidase-like Fe-S oxidoreductase
VDALSVYVHVPWCRAICPYCDFNVHRAAGMDEARFLGAIEAEIARAASEPPFAGRRAATIFLGGGTPSLLAPETVARLVDAIVAAFPRVRPEIETTLEANPENLEPERLRRFR